MSLKLAIATRISPGHSRLAKVPGSQKKNGVAIQRAVAHVGLFERREILRHGCSRVFWREVENLAEFDGPHAAQAARQFAEMRAKGSTHTREMGRCVADGPPVEPPARWAQVEEAQIEILVGFDAPTDATEIADEAPTPTGGKWEVITTDPKAAKPKKSKKATTP